MYLKVLVCGDRNFNDAVLIPVEVERGDAPRSSNGATMVVQL